ncbi:hypothetical protein FSST1_009677 [Fusarium sambucinum]
MPWSSSSSISLPPRRRGQNGVNPFHGPLFQVLERAATSLETRASMGAADAHDSESQPAQMANPKIKAPLAIPNAPRIQSVSDSPAHKVTGQGTRYNFSKVSNAERRRLCDRTLRLDRGGGQERPKPPALPGAQ